MWWNVGGALLGLPGATATVLKTLSWARTFEEEGYINVGAFQVVLDPSELPNYTRVKDLQGRLQRLWADGLFRIRSNGSLLKGM
jgi:hypothetical protein